MALDLLRKKSFEIAFHGHAQAILEVDFPQCVAEIESALAVLEIRIAEIIGSGGGEAKGTQRLRHALDAKGWKKARFEIKKIINGVERESQSHEIDHVRQIEGRGVVALEIEWNNKDPFFDRDLENFKRLHAEGAISAGIIITRGPSLQDALLGLVERYAIANNVASSADLIRLGLAPTSRQKRDYERRAQGEKSFAQAWAESFVADKFGASTTHWRKLDDRIRRGVGSPCPLLLIGLPAEIIRV